MDYFTFSYITFVSLNFVTAVWASYPPITCGNIMSDTVTSLWSYDTCKGLWCPGFMGFTFSNDIIELEILCSAVAQ